MDGDEEDDDDIDKSGLRPRGLLLNILMTNGSIYKK